MVRRCILHFGMHKTGSTSIQKSLFHLNEDVPWVYLHAGKPNASVAVQTMFCNRLGRNSRHVKEGLNDAEIKRRKQKYFKRMETRIASTDKDVLLSGEGISVLSEIELRRLLDWLGQFVDEVVAVGYVRPPKAYMESAFQQIVKGGRSNFNLAAVYPEYRERFEKFEALLGKDKVHYWLFDPKTFPSGCVVRDFAARLGVNLAAEHVQRVNESISKEALALLYSYRKYGRDGYGIGGAAIMENTRLIRKLAEIKGHKLRFSPDLVGPVLARNAQDIAWMEERLGRSFEENWEAHSEFEVAEESDMLKFNEDSLATIRQWVGESGTANRPEDVALLVGRLRRKLAADSKRPTELPNMVGRWIGRRLHRPADALRQLGRRLFTR